MSRNSDESTTEKSELERQEQLKRERRTAKKGDFFFADFAVRLNDVRRAPVFIIGGDPLDVIACGCTRTPARTEFDVGVTLKENTCVRTNKIYTFPRDQLEFKISQRAGPEDMEKITKALRKALGL